MREGLKGEKQEAERGRKRKFKWKKILDSRMSKSEYASARSLGKYSTDPEDTTFQIRQKFIAEVLKKEASKGANSRGNNPLCK